MRSVRLNLHCAAPLTQVGEFGEDNRAGINRTLHRISCLRNRDGGIVGLTCRVGRAVPGSAALIADLAASGRSILLLGRPGSGKTTVLRDVSRMLAAECRRRVVIVDTRCKSLPAVILSSCRGSAYETHRAAANCGRRAAYRAYSHRHCG